MEHIYAALRQEILFANQLLHWFTFVTVVLLIFGLALCERRASSASVALPLLTVAWAASVVRFDVFIHRTGAYLKGVESGLLRGIAMQGWEEWKALHKGGGVLIAVGDAVIFAVVLALTALLLHGPTREYFTLHRWRGHRLYMSAVLGATLALLLAIPFVPLIAAY